MDPSQLTSQPSSHRIQTDDIELDRADGTANYAQMVCVCIRLRASPAQLN